MIGCSVFDKSAIGTERHPMRALLEIRCKKCYRVLHIDDVYEYDEYEDRNQISVNVVPCETCQIDDFNRKATMVRDEIKNTIYKMKKELIDMISERDAIVRSSIGIGGLPRKFFAIGSVAQRVLDGELDAVLGDESK